MTHYLITRETANGLSDAIGHLCGNFIDQGYDEGAEKLDELGNKVIETPLTNPTVLEETTASELLVFLKATLYDSEKYDFDNEDGTPPEIQGKLREWITALAATNAS